MKNTGIFGIYSSVSVVVAAATLHIVAIELLQTACGSKNTIISLLLLVCKYSESLLLIYCSIKYCIAFYSAVTRLHRGKK